MNNIFLNVYYTCVGAPLHVDAGAVAPFPPP